MAVQACRIGKRMGFIKDIIEDVVDAMKYFVHTGLTNDGLGYYTITVADVDVWRVNARMYFDVSGSLYYGKVTSITGTDITVLLDTAKADIVTIDGFYMDLNFRHGHPVDVFDQLSRMAKDANYKKRRFPVIALMQDYEEDAGIGMDQTQVQIIIAVRTKASYTASERYTYSFEGMRLQKIYERFIKYLRVNHESYFLPSDHKKTDRLYWGKAGALGGDDNKAYDFIDAIELNINLKTFKNC